MTWELIFQLAVIGFMALMFFIIAGAAIASLFGSKKGNRTQDQRSQREEQDGREELG